MKIRLFGAVTLAFCMFFATVASAGTLAYNSSLVAPGLYGSGGLNAGFNVFTNGDLELGLGAIIRFQALAPELDNTYYVPVGPTTEPGQTGPAWGFTFSVNTQAAGGTAHLSDYTFLLTMKNLTTPGTLAFDPLALDNKYYDGSAVTKPIPTPTTAFLGTQSGFQNTESPAFFSFFVPAFDMNVPDNYSITLSATSASAPSGAVSILVNSTPEPATLGLIGSALLGLGVLRSRRSRRNK